MSESLQTAFHTLLSESEDVTDMVGDRIRPDQLGEHDGLPAIILEIAANSSLPDLSGLPSPEGNAVVNVVCIAGTRTQATELEEIVRETLNGPPGIVGEFDIEALVYTDTGFEHEPSADGSDEDDWFLNVVKFELFYRKG